MSTDRRIKLQLELESLYKEAYPDAKKAAVYFQPPSNIKMTYPCIIYSRDSADTKFADNRIWHYTQRYQIIIIDKVPDTPLIDKITEKLTFRFDRHYVADNLNHDVFDIFY